MINMMKLDERDFEKKIIGRTVAILFYADWCPFCRDFKPLFEKYERKSNFEFAEFELNNEKHPFWDKFNIKVIPTIIILRKNKEVWRRDGILNVGLTEKDLEDMLEESKNLPWEDGSIVRPLLEENK